MSPSCFAYVAAAVERATGKLRGFTLVILCSIYFVCHLRQCEMAWQFFFCMLLHIIEIDGGFASPSAATDSQHVREKCLEYD